MLKKYLLVSLQNKFGINERTLVKDAILLKKSDFNPLILCLANSPIHIVAAEHEIDCFTLKKIKLEKFIYQFKLMHQLKKTLRLTIPDIVLNYDYQCLFPTGWVLRKFPQTYYIFCAYSVPPWASLSLMKKYVLKRIHLIRVGASPLIKPLVGLLEGQKVASEVVGMNSFWNFKLEYLGRNELPDEEYHYHLGCYIDSQESMLAAIDLLVRCFTGKKVSDQKKWAVTFLCPAFWNVNFMIGKISKIAQERSVTIENFFFEQIHYGIPKKLQIHAWLEFFPSEVTNDFVMSAIEEGIPVLMPRTSSSHSSFFKKKKRLFFYRAFDARDLRSSLKSLSAKLMLFPKQPEDEQTLWPSNSLRNSDNYLKRLVEESI